jgi:hypothetical protein
MPTYKNRVAVRPAAQLWHYTSLDALKKILEGKKLRLRRIDTYWEDDPFEGSVPMEQMNEQATILGSQAAALMKQIRPHFSPHMDVPHSPTRNRWEDIAKWREGKARSIHVSCWTKGESEVMWRLYCADGADGERKADCGRKGYGVAFQTTFRKMKAFVERHDLIVSQVQYRRYDDGHAFDDELDPFFHKRKNFRIEREVRLLKFNADHYNQIVTAVTSDTATPAELEKYIDLDWFPAKVINRIWISPYADNGYAQKVRDAIKIVDPSMMDRLKRSALTERYPPQR